MSARPLEVRSPFDGSPVAEVERDDDASWQRKLARAVEAQRAWSGLAVEARCARVREALGAFRADRDAIARDVTRQMGKPLAEALREVDTLLDRADACLGLAAQALADERVEPRPGDGALDLRIVHEPHGVVLDVAAWNYPLLIPVNVVVPALLAGNAVLLKHSELTPLTGAAFTRAFAGLGPEGLVADLVIDHEQAARLIDDRRVGHVAFTGSVRGGQAVHARVARRVLDVGLELGGKDPAYVAEDADVEKAAAGIVDGACYNAGQSCCAVERAYVHASLWDAFVERAEALMRAYRLGDPLEDATTMGPLALPSALDVLERQVQDAAHRGARVVTGGRRGGGAGASSFPPTLVVDAPQDCELVQEESFGPTLPLLKVRDDEEALALMEDSRYGLTASVWTSERARAERLARRLTAGTVYQNRCDYLHPLLPWTGTKDSGIGSTLSRHGFLQLTRRKALHFRA